MGVKQLRNFRKQSLLILMSEELDFGDAGVAKRVFKLSIRHGEAQFAGVDLFWGCRKTLWLHNTMALIGR
jgi:hypothetical protein